MLGLRTTIYRVNELNEAKSWYSKAFGVEPYFDEPFYVGFNIGGYELGLHPDASSKGDNVVVYWGVEDIQKSYRHLLKIGAAKHQEPTNVGGELMVASVHDPWNNIIGIIYNPDFKRSNNL